MLLIFDALFAHHTPPAQQPSATSNVAFPVHNGGDDADPTIAIAIGIHPDFASVAKLVGISFLAPP